MNTTTPTLANDRFALPAAARTAAPRPGHWLGAALIAEALLSLAPMAVLAPAIGWPASLGKPAAEQLGAIAAQPGAVQLGYGLYLLYSVLIAPLMIALAARWAGGLHRPWGATVVAFAALSALARSIGILRWLTVMPALATAHATADPKARATIERVFDAVHLYGGGIGELLGVALFMALAMGALGLAMLRNPDAPRWLGALAIAVALLLGAVSLPAFGMALRLPIAAAVSALTLWMIAAGVRAMIRD
jgi:hypothetical protein